MRNQHKKLVMHTVTILAIAFMAVHSSASNQYVDKVAAESNEPESSLESVTSQITSNPVTSQPPKEEVIPEEQFHYPEFTYSKDWSYEESYLLAKIAMAEAEGESIQGKTLVILTILNRVWSDEFPDTIEEVILQKSNGVYQFSPVIPGGRWYTTEPNEDCWEAVRVVQEAIYDYSGGALYFESCEEEDNWHSRNLEFLYQEGNHRFYK